MVRSSENRKISGVYICGLEIEDKTGDTIVEFLEAHPELPVYFGPGPRLNRIDGELMSRIFALHPMVHLNEDEICRYTQCDSIENAAKALYRKTENTVIVTNGANGAFFFDGEDFIHVPPVPAVKSRRYHRRRRRSYGRGYRLSRKKV